jgi:hypothetical protein
MDFEGGKDDIHFFQSPRHDLAGASFHGGAGIGKGVLPQRTRSVPVSFCSLPDDTSRNIYARVLVVAHPIFLFQDTGSQVVQTFAPEKPFR